MHARRWSLIALALALLTGLAPAYADGSPVTDKGRNVYLVDGQQGPLYSTLPGEDVEKIKALYKWNNSQLLSPISPDDQVALAATQETLGFLNIQDGAFTAINVDTAFDSILPAPLLGVGTFSWRDERTLLSFGIVQLARGRVEPAIVTIDRITGAVNAEVVSGISDTAQLLDISPKSQWLLLVEDISQPSDDSTETEAVRMRLTLPSANEALTAQPTQLQQRLKARLARLGSVATRLLTPSPLLSADRHTMAVNKDVAQITLYSTVTGETRDLRTVQSGTNLLAAAWSHDDSRLALSVSGYFDYQEQPDYRSEKSYDGALLSEEVYRDVTGNLPPAENPFFQNNVVESYDLNNGDAEISTLQATDGNGDLLIGVDWSTDNQTLLVEALTPGRLAGRRYPIYTPQFAGGVSWRFYSPDLQERSRLSDPAFSGISTARGMFVSPDEVIFNGLSGTDYQPYYYNRVTGELRRIGREHGSYGQVVSTNRSRQLVFSYSSFSSPPELYRLNWDGTALGRLTWGNEELRQLNSTKNYPVSFTLANKQTRAGTLILPAGTAFPPKNLPIVVWQEGGPGGPMNNFWLPPIVESPYTLLPNFGFGLLVVPLAGREGNGPKTVQALYDGKNFGQRDIDEQAEIVRQMIARGWTAKGKVGITGCSYGGYFALQSAARYPDLYAAASPQCALVDTINEWSRGYAALMPYTEGLPPYNALTEYRNDSPLYNASRIKAAVLTFHETEDFLPVTLNQNLHLQLVNQGTPAKMFVFQGSGHGIIGQGGSIDVDQMLDYEYFAAQEQINWFRTYLK